MNADHQRRSGLRIRVIGTGALLIGTVANMLHQNYFVAAILGLFTVLWFVRTLYLHRKTL